MEQFRLSRLVIFYAVGIAVLGGSYALNQSSQVMSAIVGLLLVQFSVHGGLLILYLLTVRIVARLAATLAPRYWGRATRFGRPMVLPTARVPQDNPLWDRWLDG